MPNNATPNTATTNTAARDQLAYEYRAAGYTWGTIAAILGMANESSARTAANRHAAAIGAAHGYVANRAGRRTGTRTHRAPRTYVRGFGVEIEFVGIDRRDAAAAVATAVGVAHVHTVEYHGRQCIVCGGTICSGEWKVERDGSVSNGLVGGEVVTPPLYGDAGLDLLKKVMRELRNAGASVDTRCGMHVHVAADGMTNAQRAETIRTLYRHHDVMDRLVAPSRRGNGYCTRPADYEIDAWARSFEAGVTPNGQKYRTINVASFPRYGTIEVRYHQGSLNGRKAAAWVRLLLAMFDSAAADATADLAPGLALLGSLADAGRLPQSDAAYLVARADALATR